MEIFLIYIFFNGFESCVGGLACPVLSVLNSEPLAGIEEWSCDKNKMKCVSVLDLSLGKGVHLLLQCERCLVSITTSSDLLLV